MADATGVLKPSDHWLLTGVPADVLQPALDAGCEMRFAPGDVIIRDGDASDGVYLMLSGTARVTAVADDGETILASIRPNEVIGEMGVLDGQPRSGTVRAATICVAYFIPSDPFIDLLERSTLVSNRLLVLLVQRLRRMNNRFLEIPGTSDIHRVETVPHTL